MPPPPAPTARSSSRSSRTRTSSSPSGGRDARGGGAATGDRELVAVGEIVAAHALRGQVRLRAYQPPAPSLRAGAEVVLERDDLRRTLRVLSAAPHARGQVLVTLEGVADRTAAEALVRARVLVPAAALPPLEEGEFYYHEIEGFRVHTVDGRALGSVVETFSTGANDVWVVRGTGREYLIPVIADVVTEIDRTGRRIVIDPLPGLLDG
jgi:16S rRNA processing protein RimM